MLSIVDVVCLWCLFIFKQGSWKTMLLIHLIQECLLQVICHNIVVCDCLYVYQFYMVDFHGKQIIMTVIIKM